MELKIGDKVRYLDAVGGGVVSAFKGKDMVLVLEEDGFETPVLARQCVVVESQSYTTQTAPKPTAPPKREISIPKTVAFKQTQSREGEMLNVSLAYLTAEGHQFQDAVFECYLINESNYSLMFNYASSSGKSWTSRSAGTIEPNSKMFLEEFGRQTINELEKLSLQILAFKVDYPYAFKNSQSVEIRLDTVKFYKIHCFKQNDFFEEEALMVPVIKNDLPERSLISDPEVLRQAMMEKHPEKPKGSIPLEMKSGPIEVDLHITSLLDTTVGMDAGAILQFQLETFRKVMEEYKNKKGTKIVFIHGKGEGVLRSALLNELKTNYKTSRSQDASFKEYGFGATQITIG